ncbi:MAG TPA: hypothetical protein VF503_01205 [Sphingobium sp.]
MKSTLLLASLIAGFMAVSMLAYRRGLVRAATMFAAAAVGAAIYTSMAVR